MNLATIIDPHPVDAVALITGARQTTYGTLREQVARTAPGLRGLGLETGDRVVILCGTDPSFVVAYLAVLHAGLVAVPLNPTSPAAELEVQLAGVGARAAVVGPSGARAVAAVERGRLPTLEHVVATDHEAAGDAPAGDPLLGELAASEPEPAAERDDGDLAVLLYTSGTAGAPRAAMLTHGNLRSNLEALQSHPGRAVSGDDVVLGVLPLFHIFGLNVALGVTLYAGAGVLLIERFDPVATLEALTRHRVTVVPGAPTMWAAWAGLPEVPSGAFSSVRLAGTGAAPMPVEVAEIVQRRFGLTLADGYGLTEASPVVTTSAGIESRPGSIGVPLAEVDVRLVDSEGDDVLVGDTGEIWVRGPNVFAGYWADPDATAAVLTRDGWLRTGDVAVVDDDGYLYIVDRIKDLVIVSGFNVYPAEVEEVLVQHPAVADAAVVGSPHPHTGETVHAWVVPAAGQPVDADQLVTFCRERLARYKCPTKVTVVDHLARNAAGKVLRRTLRVRGPLR